RRAHPRPPLPAPGPPSRPGARDALRHAREASAVGRVLLRERGAPAGGRAGRQRSAHLGRARAVNRYVAFLRAVNVGGRTVRMAELTKRLGRLGLKDVSTFIASGNVCFTALDEPDALGRHIEADLLAWLGYPVATMVRRWDELEALAE